MSAISIICIIISLTLLYFSRKINKKPAANDKDIFEEYRTAIHESGHAVCAHSCTNIKDIKSVQDFGNGSGYIKYSFHSLDSVEDWFSEVVISLAGITAETIVFGNGRTSHSEVDLNKALRFAQSISFKESNFIPPLAKDTVIDFSKYYYDHVNLTEHQKQILTSAYYTAKEIIKSHGPKFYELATFVQRNKIAYNSDVDRILGTRLMISFLGNFKTTFIYKNAA